jgi:hypothetical protein
MVQVTMRSSTERLSRKKYIGVWSLESSMERRMMELFPIRVKTWETRTTAKRGISSHGCSENPKRINILGKLTFPPAMDSVLCIPGRNDTVLKDKHDFSLSINNSLEISSSLLIYW